MTGIPISTVVLKITILVLLMAIILTNAFSLGEFLLCNELASEKLLWFFDLLYTTLYVIMFMSFIIWLYIINSYKIILYGGQTN